MRTIGILNLVVEAIDTPLSESPIINLAKKIFGTWSKDATNRNDSAGMDGAFCHEELCDDPLEFGEGRHCSVEDGEPGGFWVSRDARGNVQLQPM